MHDIIKVDTNNLYNANRDQSRPGGDGASGVGAGSTRKAWDRNKGRHRHGMGWSGLLLRIVLLIVVAGGAYVGYTVWRTQKRRSSRYL